MLVLFLLTGCGWVDSTGEQPDSAPVFIDASLTIVNADEPFKINENTQRTMVFNGDDNQLTDWSWSLLDGQADIQRCLNFNDFEQLHASNSLQQSCASNGSCEFQVEEILIDNITRFNLTAPHMRSPAALEYLVTAQQPDGERIERRQLLCAIPINEAPEAIDDRITILRGTTLQISGDDELSLLANDTDDQDVRNSGLQVHTTPVTPPGFAAEFQLFSDGGFYYQPFPDAPTSSNGSISDRFTYAVSDGTNTSMATVSIKIIDFNTAPIQNSDIPEIQAIISDRNEDIEFDNLALYFSDAENDELEFHAYGETLPDSGNVYLTNDGKLEGNPLSYDSGRYLVNFSVSDFNETIESHFYLNVVRSNGRNSSPYADDISNIVVRNEFSYDVSYFFGDEDNDHLTFTATGLPENVKISPNGVVSGTSSDINRGSALVRVTANDGNGGTEDDTFRMWLR